MTGSRYDCLYVSPHPEDVRVSCPARLLSEASRGLRVLVVSLFDSRERPREPGLAVDVLPLGFPEARRRDPAYASLRAALYGRTAADDALVPEAARLLDQIAHRTRARRVYLPLGVGGHIDHRLGHEAGLRAFDRSAGRDIFFYEDRPYALVPGAVWIRLAQIGVRLPPAAAHAARPAGLARFLFRVHGAACEGARFEVWWERAWCAGLAAREWRRAHAWRPFKALGPRLQPMLHEEGEAAERYWLLLPPREHGLLGHHAAEALADAVSVD